MTILNRIGRRALPLIGQTLTTVVILHTLTCARTGVFFLKFFFFLRAVSTHTTSATTANETLYCTRQRRSIQQQSLTMVCPDDGYRELLPFRRIIVENDRRNVTLFGADNKRG